MNQQPATYSAPGPTSIVTWAELQSMMKNEKGKEFILAVNNNMGQYIGMATINEYSFMLSPFLNFKIEDRSTWYWVKVIEQNN
jgi:hypothetical protein